MLYDLNSLLFLQVWGSSGSPQSTLCAMGSGCGCKQSSSRGSPNGHYQASHPQLTLDLLYAAAGEVSKMRMNEEAYGFINSCGPLAPPRKPSPVSVPLKNREPDVEVYQQLQASQVSTTVHSLEFFIRLSALSLMGFCFYAVSASETTAAYRANELGRSCGTNKGRCETTSTPNAAKQRKK